MTAKNTYTLCKQHGTHGTRINFARDGNFDPTHKQDLSLGVDTHVPNAEATTDTDFHTKRKPCPCVVHLVLH